MLTADVMQKSPVRSTSQKQPLLFPGKVNEGYPVRIFTPEEEIGFAGHPSLGTAFIINRYLEDGKAGISG